MTRNPASVVEQPSGQARHSIALAHHVFQVHQRRAEGVGQAPQGPDVGDRLPVLVACAKLRTMPPSPATSAQLRRLLDLFPASVITEHFEVDATKDDAIAEIVDSDEAEATIFQFARANHWLTHQHVYLFELQRISPADLPDDPVGLPLLYESNTGRARRSWFYFLEVQYNIVIDNPLAHETMDFLWPLFIDCRENRLLLSFTILQTSLRPYLPDARPLVRSERSLNENRAIGLVLDNSDLLDRSRPLDFNAGIKALWDADMIDAPTVQYKRELATATEAMDEEFLVKRDDPDLYNRTRESPLLNTLFYWRGEDGPGIEKFTVDPSQGFFRFRRFSDSVDAVPNLIEAILERN